MVWLQADDSGLALRARSRASRALSCIALAPLIRLFCRLEYANVQMLWWKFYWLSTRVLILFTKQSWKLKTNKSESVSQSIPERREPDRMSEYRERKPTSKGLLARVKCQQRNARMSRDPLSLSQASWIGFFEKILLCCWFHYFSVLSRFSKPFWKRPKESRLRTCCVLLMQDHAISLIIVVWRTLQNHSSITEHGSFFIPLRLDIYCIGLVTIWSFLPHGMT